MKPLYQAIGYRAAYFFAFLGLFTLAYQIGGTTEIDSKEAQQFFKEFAESLQGLDAVGIFSHNTAAALPMFIPGAGAVWGVFTGWSTGIGFASIATVNPMISGVPPLALLYFTPFGVLEVVAYSIGMSRSYILIKMILKKINPRTSLKPTSIEIGIAVGLLLIAAFIENSMMIPI